MMKLEMIALQKFYVCEEGKIGKIPRDDSSKHITIYYEFSLIETIKN